MTWRDTSVTWRDIGVTWRDTSVTWRDKNLHAVTVAWPSRDCGVTVPWLWRERELDRERDRYRERDRERDRERERDRDRYDGPKRYQNIFLILSFMIKFFQRITIMIY